MMTKLDLNDNSISDDCQPNIFASLTQLQELNLSLNSDCRWNATSRAFSQA